MNLKKLALTILYSLAAFVLVKETTIFDKAGVAETSGKPIKNCQGNMCG